MATIGNQNEEWDAQMRYSHVIDYEWEGMKQDCSSAFSVIKASLLRIIQIALNITISWKMGKALIEIQYAGIIILVLKFSSQITLRDNIGINDKPVRFFESVWFCEVEFNSIYPANKNGVFSSQAIDIFGKIWLIQVSSIANYGNKRFSRSDRVVLILK